MIPTIGRTVIVLGISSNGSEQQPAVITRVWATGRDTRDGPIGVNLTVFPDCAAPQVHGSVMLFHDHQAALARRGENPRAICAYWPELARVA